MARPNTQDATRNHIAAFVQGHPFCLFQDIVDGLHGKSTRGTINKVLKDMVKEDQVRNQKVTPNARDNRYVINESNPFVVAESEIKRFSDAFFPLYKEICKSFYGEGSVAKITEEPVFRATLDNQLVAMFNAMSARFFFMLRVHWVRKISDQDMRAKLIATVYLRLSQLENEFIEISDTMRTWEFEQTERLHSIYSDINCFLHENEPDSKIWKQSKYKDRFLELFKMLEIPGHGLDV